MLRSRHSRLIWAPVAAVVLATVMLFVVSTSEPSDRVEAAAVASLNLTCDSTATPGSTAICTLAFDSASPYGSGPYGSGSIVDGVTVSLITVLGTWVANGQKTFTFDCGTVSVVNSCTEHVSAVLSVGTTTGTNTVVATAGFVVTTATIIIQTVPSGFTVDSTGDAVDASPGDGSCADAGGKCTLRAAVQETNASSSVAQTITLPAGTYTLSVGGIGEGAAATGDLDVTSTLTIVGAGQSTTIIDGGALDRIFEVISGGNLSISGVTIRNGSVPSTSTDFGGGIANRGTLTLTDSTVSGSSGGSGGGLYISSSATATVTGSTITGNTASFAVGGGILSFGAVTFQNSTISNNTAPTGGGLYWAFTSGVVAVTDSTISGNTATTRGGGLANQTDSAALTLTNSTISGNSSPAGGGIVHRSTAGAITVTNSTITANTATSDGYGGGINSGGTLTLTDSTVSDNLAGHGGGVFNGSSGTATVTRGTITGNTATVLGGGAILSFGALTLEKSTLASNTAHSGGGLYSAFSTGTLTVTSSTIMGNTATSIGGGLTNQHDSAAITITNSTISGNTAPTGGAIYNRSTAGAVGLTNATITENTATTVTGSASITSGATYGWSADGTITVSSSTAAASAASAAAATTAGSGIFGVDGTTTTITNTIVAGNPGSDCGGTITTGGHNLDSDSTCLPTPATGDRAGSDALLGPLADNGGPAQTHALLAGSPAIDGGSDSAAPATDQRGFGRIGVSDIGAFEFNAAPPTLSGIVPQSGLEFGGESVVITGTWLSSATAVTFGTTAATILSQGATFVAVLTPSHPPGVVDVVVTAPGGSATLAGAFTFEVFEVSDDPGAFEPAPEPTPEPATEVDETLADAGVLDEGETVEEAVEEDLTGFLADVEEAGALDDLGEAIIEDEDLASTIVNQALEDEVFTDVLVTFVESGGNVEETVDALVAPALEQEALAPLLAELAESEVLDEVIAVVEKRLAGDAVIDETVDLSDETAVTTRIDEATGDEIAVVAVTSADDAVTAVVPVRALAAGVKKVTARIEPIKDVALLTANIPIPSVVSVVDSATPDQSAIIDVFVISISDQDGEAIEDFADDVTFSVKVDPQIFGSQSVVVVFFDVGVGQWVQLPTSVTADGTVTWSTRHLTLFSLLRLRTVAQELVAGLNPITFTGPSDTPASEVASAIGIGLETLLRFNAPTQSFLIFVPGAPGYVNSLITFDQRDAFFARIAPGQTGRFETAELIPSPNGLRSVVLIAGLNPIAFVGNDGTEIEPLLESIREQLVSASRFDAPTQTWQVFVPDAPPAVNTLRVLNRLDVLFLLMTGDPIALILPDVTP